MICVTCGCNIPPAFVHAISINVCAGCSGPIMTDESKKLMDDLKEAMVKMPNDPEGLAGWLLSTYDLFPKGTVEPTEFHRKRSREDGGAGVTVGPDGRPLKRANSASEIFMKRANVDKIKKNPKVAALQNALNSMNSVDSNLYGGDYEEEMEVSDEEEADLENHNMLEMIAKAKAKGRTKIGAAELLANSSDFGSEGGELSHAELMRVQQLVGGSGHSSGDPDMDGFENLPPMLQADRLKRLQAQRELSFGGASGVIKRSS